ncbi:MAG: hypothetical protein ACFFAU_01480 [Candidatus Hodarchaeota archaeon]
MDKNRLYGVGGMMVGGALVVTGLLQIPVLPVVLIVVGGAVGFIGYKFFNGEFKI